MSGYCPAGKIVCEHCSNDVYENRDKYCHASADLPITSINIEACPYPSLQKPVEEKIVLELTQAEARSIHYYTVPEDSVVDKKFGVSVEGVICGSSIAGKIKALAKKWDETHGAQR